MISDSDFNQIFEENDEDADTHSDQNFPVIVPDPIIVRGAGNVTM